MAWLLHGCLVFDFVVVVVVDGFLLFIVVVVVVDNDVQLFLLLTTQDGSYLYFTVEKIASSSCLLCVLFFSCSRCCRWRPIIFASHNGSCSICFQKERFDNGNGKSSEFVAAAFLPSLCVCYCYQQDFFLLLSLLLSTGVFFLLLTMVFILFPLSSTAAGWASNMNTAMTDYDGFILIFDVSVKRDGSR